MTRHTKSDFYERQSSPTSRRSRLRHIVVCYPWLHSMVCSAPAWLAFFVHICTSAFRVLDDLFTAIVRGAIRLFAAALSCALIAAMLFGLVRTIFHPWFGG